MRIELGSLSARSGILRVIIELRNCWVRISDSVIRVNYDKDVFKIEWDSILVKDISNIKRR
jgi:hypothetical protein